ncbi:MAG TPA: CpsD/CapB family tyrosine-protein kinase [Vicinamibacterales bacterium]|nr:CpsD/CapB family tyrosine-protein kinase [Vicinamibacterales bacterium]
MTRLSDALRRAQESTGAQPTAGEEAVPSSAAWKFAPVETMHVPQEGAVLAPRDPELRLDGQTAETDHHAPGPIEKPTAPSVRMGDADRNKLIIGDNVDASMVEQYRHLAAVMHHAQKASGVRSVMVTSALPSEGKTLTATNLALTLSESYQRRVLLIDADLRRPRMREMFALPSAEGLTDSLAQPREGKLPVQQITPRLWVLTSGHVLPDPMSLLVSPAMKQLIDDAKESFDWVVVDTPPIAILPDANLLAGMIDTTLLVVSAQSTPYPMVQRAAQAVGTNRILGVVLNRAEEIGLPKNYGYYGAKNFQPGHPLPERKQWLGWFRRRGRHVQ